MRIDIIDRVLSIRELRCSTANRRTEISTTINKRVLSDGPEANKSFMRSPYDITYQKSFTLSIRKERVYKTKMARHKPSHYYLKSNEIIPMKKQKALCRLTSPIPYRRL